MDAALKVHHHRNTLPAQYRLFEYEIQHVLGKPGGFGITYLATDTNLYQSVAIKEYLPSDFAIREGVSTVLVRSTADEPSFQWGMRCFIEEARVLAKFNHPNIVRVLRFFEANNTAYMVMEYQDGECLADVLKTRQVFDQSALLELVLPLLDGLEKIHEAGFLHRDIKPNNIYIRKDNTPVLLDFGSARYAIGQKSRSVTSIVTPGYAPLEQYDNELEEQGPWTDIYALGGVMYCAINGEPPPAATRRVMKDPMVPAIEIGDRNYRIGILQAIDWALQLSEQDRPRSVAAWRDKILVENLEQTEKSRVNIAKSSTWQEKVLSSVNPQTAQSDNYDNSDHTQRFFESRQSILGLAGIFFIFLLGAAAVVLFHLNQELAIERSKQLELEQHFAAELFKQQAAYLALQEQLDDTNKRRRQLERVIAQVKHFDSQVYTEKSRFFWRTCD